MKSSKSETKPRRAVRDSSETEGSSVAGQNSNSEIHDSQTVLLAVTGMSPAVLTETVWALAHPKARGEKPVIPQRVIILSTIAGKKQIEKELLQAPSHVGAVSVWESMRQVILGNRQDLAACLMIDDIRVITAPNHTSGVAEALPDIRGPADNEAAADFIMEEIRRIVENPDTRLVASLAGGRKTMGALLYACMSLLGRPQDRLTHVLVNEPFENPGLTPRFYFPSGKDFQHQLKDKAGHVISEHPHAGADLELADVPFVRLRKLFPKQIGKFPGRFNALVAAYSEEIDQISGPPPSVALAGDRPAISVNGVFVETSIREYALYAYFLHRLETGVSTDIMQKDCLDDLKVWLPQWAEIFPVGSFQRRVKDEWKCPIEDDLRKQINSLRNKFTTVGFTPLLKQLLPMRGRFGIQVTVR
ncbi:MAG: CRISPR-associated ring nuclease Csm6 [Limisphaerales bacterium]